MVRNIVLGLILIVFAAACSKEKPQEVAVEATPSVTPAPAPVNQASRTFKITTTDGKTVPFNNVPGKVLAIFFNPSCDHCQKEADLIQKNIDVLKDYEVYFISPEPLDSISKFSYDHKLLDKNLHFAQGNGPEIIDAVGPINQVPSFIRYNDKAIVGRNEGEMSIEQLKRFLE